METRIEVLSTSIDELDLMVRQIDEAIRGNGTPGIQTRLALSEQRLDQISRYVEEIHGLRRWMFLGVVSLLGSMAWQAIQFFLQQPQP